MCIKVLSEKDRHLASPITKNTTPSETMTNTIALLSERGTVEFIAMVSPPDAPC